MKEFKRQEIKTLMETVSEQIGQILNYDNVVPQIEIDIVKENLRKIYDEINYINLLHKEKMPDKTVEPEEVSEAMDEETEELLDYADKQFENQEPGVDSEKEKPVGKSSLFDFEEEKTEEQQPEPPEPVEEKKPEEKKEKPVENKSIHELATEKSIDKTLGENITSKSITNLKKFISINDKFQFANELFDGKMAVYNEHIDKIDILKSLEEAEKLIENLIKEFGWDTDSDIYRHFMSYIERRFRA